MTTQMPTQSPPFAPIDTVRRTAVEELSCVPGGADVPVELQFAPSSDTYEQAKQ